MRKRRARHIEIRVDVRAERSIELFVGDVLDRFLVLLIGGVVDEDIQPAKHFDRAVDGLGAEFRILHIAGDQQRAASFIDDGLLRHFCVRFFDRQVHDCDVGAFARKQDGNGPSDAGIAAGDERRLPAEFVGPAVLGGFEFRPRPKA